MSDEELGTRALGRAGGAELVSLPNDVETLPASPGVLARLRFVLPTDITKKHPHPAYYEEVDLTARNQMAPQTPNDATATR